MYELVIQFELGMISRIFFPHFGLNKDLNVVSLVLLPWSLAGFVLVLSSSSQLSIEMNSRRNFIFDAMGKF